LYFFSTRRCASFFFFFATRRCAFWQHRRAA
jgi:hypothetical protein